MNPVKRLINAWRQVWVPHDPYETKNWLVGCSCGAMFYTKDKQALRRHLGHLYSPVTEVPGVRGVIVHLWAKYLLPKETETPKVETT